MFQFLKKIFKGKENNIYEIEMDKAIKAQIKYLKFDDQKIIATNIDGIDIVYFYKDILSIYIIVDASDYLPQPRWIIQNKTGGINIYNDLKNADKLFFEVLNTKLEGYNSDQTQQEILKAMGCVDTGFFSIWERQDVDETPKNFEK